MSYILEALKKSEQERERGSVPDIKSIHSSSEATADSGKRAWWPYLLLLVLLINGVIFAVVYMGKDKVGSSSQADNDQQVASIINEPPVVPIPTPSETAQAQQSEPQPAAAEEPTPQAKPQPQQPKVIFSKEPLDMSSDVADEVQSGASQSGDPKLTGAESSTNQELKEENIQAVMISELPDSIRQSIPSIEFAGHVYSSTVERRSVMLNGRKMREGDAVSADLFLHAITPDGAEFDYQGYRFKLNALQDWSSR